MGEGPKKNVGKLAEKPKSQEGKEGEIQDPCLRYKDISNIAHPNTLPVLEACTANLPASKRAQKNLKAIVDESEMESEGPYATPDLKDFAERGSVIIGRRILEKSKELGGDKDKLYSYLINVGKTLRQTNKAGFFNFIRALDNALYMNYGSSTENLKESGGEEVSAIEALNVSGKSYKSLECAQISKIMLDALKDMGVEAYAVGGVYSESGKDIAGAHYATLVKVDKNTYALLGVSDAKMFQASNTVEAFKIATRISPNLMSSGILQFHGQEDGKYYSSYALGEEAAFGEKIDYNSATSLTDMKLNFDDLDYLNDAQKRGIEKQMSNAKAHGLKLRSISFRTEGSFMQGKPSQGAEIVFTGINKNGDERVLIFDIDASVDNQKMSMLWKVYSDTRVDQFSVEIRGRETDGTTMYESSKAIGAEVKAASTWQISPNDAIRAGGDIIIEGISGDTYGGKVTDSYLTAKFGFNLTYVKTLGPIDLWIGSGADLMGVGSRMEGKLGGEEFGGESFSAAMRFKETAGARYKNIIGKRLKIDTRLTISLVHDLAENNVIDQYLTLDTGTELQGRMNIFYKVSDELGFMGRLNGTQLTMPSFEKQIAGYRIGVTLQPVEDVRLTVYVGSDVSKTTLNMGPETEVIEYEPSKTIGTQFTLREGRLSARVGLDVTQYSQSNITDVRGSSSLGISF